MARKQWVQIKTEDGEYKLVPKEERHLHERKSAMIMPDMEPMKSPIDGSIISSRSAYREHMKKHGVIDVGNEKLKPARKEYKSDDGIKQTLYHLWENLPQHGPR